MTAGLPPDMGIDAAILDRMTDTLIILQAKSATTDRGTMIAALQALRGRHPGAQVILVEGESDARVIRECLQSIERTSLGAAGARQTRAKATAERVADILIRHQGLPENGEATVQVWDPAVSRPRVLTGHVSLVTAVAFSPDGNLFAGARDGTVRVWDLASGGSDTRVRIWDLASGKDVPGLLTGHGSVQAMAFSPDGNLLASASDDGRVRLWDPDKNLLTGASDATVRIWDPASGALTGHVSLVTAVAFSPDGNLFAGARDGTVRVWDLASGGSDTRVRIWDLASGKDVPGLLTGHGSVQAMAFSPDGNLLASASDDGRVRLWDTVTGQQVRTLADHAAQTTSVAFSPRGNLLASARDDGTVRLWDTATGRSHVTLTGHDRPVSGMAFSPDGNQIAAASEREVLLWDLAAAG